jgi:hypothetical protein
VVKIAVDCENAYDPECKEKVGIAAIWEDTATLARKTVAKTKKDTRQMNPRLVRLIKTPKIKVPARFAGMPTRTAGVPNSAKGAGTSTDRR